MEVTKVKIGEPILREGERMRQLLMLVQGKVRATYKTHTWELEPGNIIGIVDCNRETYLCTYTAVTECILYAYPYTQPEDFLAIYQAEQKYVSAFLMASMRQTAMHLRWYQQRLLQAQKYYGFLMEMYQEYQHLCADYRVAEYPLPRMEMAKPFVPGEHIQDCMVQCYEDMATIQLERAEALFRENVYLGIGEIINGTRWMQQALQLMEELQDYFRVQKGLLISDQEDCLYKGYMDLLYKALESGMDDEPLRHTIQQMIEYAKECGLYDQERLELLFEKYREEEDGDTELTELPLWDPMDESVGSEDIVPESLFQYLLNYADFPKDQRETFGQDIDEFKKLSDPYSTNNEVHKLRKRLTNSYYQLYHDIMKKSLETKVVPNQVKMFLTFGVLDEELTGETAVRSISSLSEQLFACNSNNVYTIYEWLCSIYRGEQEPSRNEFDMDYTSYLNELRKTGKITEQQQKDLAVDQWKKVEFEMENMFVTNNRLTYGKISIFCPILCEHDIIHTIEHMLVTAQRIQQSINEVRSIDYSVFYRQVVFSDPKHDINMEMIQQEVLPIVILMPNAGSKAMMWQETSNMHRDTPARFTFPILTMGNLTDMMVEVAGRYRWEMCRKIQGYRWNDVSEPSLTSEFHDYMMYYRKNRDLTTEAREKVKQTLLRCKNNYREVFVREYQNWITYEAKGSLRLNRVVREILEKYCPFSKKVREELQINPMYQELFAKEQIRRERSIKRLDMLYARYQKKGGEITRQLQENREFYDL